MRAFLALTVAVVVSIGLGVAAVVGLGTDSIGQPVFANAPRVSPVTQLSDGGCGYPEQSSRTSIGYVTVNVSPIDVTAVWLPGLNEKPCAAVITHGDQAVAGVLAADVNREPEVAPGSYLCPVAVGTQVNLYFNYGTAGPSELVEVALSGCRWIFAPGRNARWWTGPRTATSFGPTLAKLAPPAWVPSFEER